MTAIVQLKTGTTNGTATASVTLTLTNPITSGNAVALQFAATCGTGTLVINNVTDNFSTVYSIDLNTQLNGQQNLQASMFCKTNITTAVQSLTISISATTGCSIFAVMYEVSGLQNGVALDQTATGISPTGGPTAGVITIPPSGVTTLAPNEFAMCLGCAGSGGTLTMDNGWSLDFTHNNFYNLMSNVLVSAGSNSCQVTNSGSTQIYYAVATYFPTAVLSYNLDQIDYF